MIILRTHAALAAVLAGALVVSTATPSIAHDRAWTAAGIGFVAGAALGAAAASADTNVYYSPYADYAYAPAVVYHPAPAYVYAPAYAYVPVYPPARVYSPEVGIHAFENGKYVGSDPDPRIRATLRAEARGN